MRKTDLVFALVTVAGCTEGSPVVTERHFNDALQTVLTYGDSVLADSSKPKYGGGQLGKVIDVADDLNGNVYVLDPAYKKVAVFGPDGSFKRNIIGGYGAGPGEFKLPIALDVVDGMVFVYDHSLARISVFDTAGQYVRTIPTTGRPYKDILVRDGSIFATPLPARTWALDIMPSSQDIAAVVHEIALTEQDERFSPDGLALMLGRDEQGGVLVGHMRAGLWFAEHAKWAVAGRELLPNAVAVKVKDDRLHPTQIYGIGSLSGGRVVICYSVLNLEQGATRAITSTGVFVDVFSADGTYLSTTEIDQGFVPAFATSADKGSILIGESDPYPRIRRVTLAAN